MVYTRDNMDKCFIAGMKFEQNKNNPNQEQFISTIKDSVCKCKVPIDNGDPVVPFCRNCGFEIKNN